MSATQHNKNFDFAFGENERHGCQCPALAAGLNPVTDDTPGLLEAAEWYDNVANEYNKGWTGVVSEEEAKKYWLEMLESARSENNIAADVAEEIAEYHDWI